MELSSDFMGISLLAALSVAVGLTSANYARELDGSRSTETTNLANTIANILGLDQEQVGGYLQGRSSEICYGTVVVHSR
ncbi:MAG: hypothetical protein QUS33_12540 [Dehalococcoidia bacterium]|nr:hypothetical protein [Dehalococcoidia bacterium]